MIASSISDLLQIYSRTLRYPFVPWKSPCNVLKPAKCSILPRYCLSPFVLLCNHRSISESRRDPWFWSSHASVLWVGRSLSSLDLLDEISQPLRAQIFLWIPTILTVFRTSRSISAKISRRSRATPVGSGTRRILGCQDGRQSSIYSCTRCTGAVLNHCRWWCIHWNTSAVHQHQPQSFSILFKLTTSHTSCPVDLSWSDSVSRRTHSPDPRHFLSVRDWLPWACGTDLWHVWLCLVRDWD